MKKLFLLTKMLLAAVLLCVGQNAWGGTMKLYSQDYQSSATSDWTSPSYGAGLSIVTDGDNKYNKWTNDGQNNRNANNWFASSLDLAGYDEYTFSVKFCIGALPKGDSKSNLSEWVIAGQNSAYGNNSGHNSSSNYYLVLAQKTYGSAEYNVQVGSTTLDDALTLTVGTWYTITQTISANSVTTVITDGSTEVFKNTNSVGYSTIGHLKGMNLLSGRYYGQQYVDDILVTVEADEEVVTDPSIAVVYAGANRTVTITSGESSESNPVTTYYTIDGTDPTTSSSVYSTPLDIDADCTVKAISISSASVASAITSQAVTVGTLKLNAPTFTKTGYAAGKYTVSMASSQTSLAYPPASYTNYYSIDGGDAVAYSDAFELSEGSTVTGYVVATNYTNSDETTLNSAARPTYYATAWTQDYRNLTSAAGTGAQSIGLSDVVFSVDGTDFMNIVSYGSPATELNLNTNVGLNTNTGVNLRTNGANSGILVNNTNTAKIGIQNLKVGDYIVLYVTGIVPTASYGCTLQEGMSTWSEYYFRATETSASINIPKGTYNYVYSITAYSSTVSKTITDAGWATLCSDKALDFSEVSGLKAYIITGTESGSTLALTQVTSVPANTGILLQGPAAEYAIPVVASADPVSGNKLVGVTSDTPIEANAGYVLMDETAGVGFYQNNKAFTVGANTAYLPADFASEARSAYFLEGVTAVEAVEAAAEAKAKEGKFIENGKLVIVKNGQKFNAAGAKLY